MGMKKVLAIGLSAAMIMSVTPGTVTAADLDADVEIEEFTDDLDEEETVISEETEVEENDSDRTSDVEFQDEESDEQQSENQEMSDDVALFSDGEENDDRSGENVRTVIDGGELNENVTWTFYDDGDLIIDGFGNMPNYEKVSDVPWYIYCKEIQELELKKGITSIGDYAFSECSTLINVEIPESIISIGMCAFSKCTLKSINISEGVITIGDYAFYGCDFTSVEIPGSVTNIGEMAFAICKNLKNIKLSKGMTCISDGTFIGCTSLKDIEIPEGITKIGTWAFEGCINLTSITIPEGVTTIENAFHMDGDGHLVGMTIPKSVTKLKRSLIDWSTKVIRFTGTQQEWENIYEGDYSDLFVIFNYKENPNHEHLYFDYKKESSCTEDGEVKSICGLCGKIGEQKIIPKSHSWKETSRIDATCTTEGKVSYICDVCDVAKKEEVLPSLGHKFSSWKTTSQATVFSPEQQSRSCSVCGKSEKREVGSKLQRTMTVTVTSLPLKTKQKTTVLKVSGLAAGDSIVSWKSNNTKVAKVFGRANGTSTITAGSKTGKAKITITLKSGLQKVVTVTVQKSTVKTKKITGVAKNLKLKRKQKAVLRPVITPLTSTEKVTYKSSNTKVATVNSKGQITAKKKGTAVITVKSGSKTVKCKVTVK